MDNKKQPISTILTSFGLSKKQADVYVATLEIGKGTVSQISRKANINRTTGYDVLDSLVSLGLVNISGKEPKQEYIAESPDALVILLSQRVNEAKDNLQKVKELVPQLKSRQRVGDRPQVRFYEGVEGIKQVYEDTLTSTEPIRAFTRVEDMHTTMGDYFPSYYKRRAGKGISIRAVSPKTPMALERAKHDVEEKREFALVPESLFSISPEINIYNNKIMIASWRENLGIIIESKEIADGMKSIFELAWEEAKRLDKECS